MSGIPGYLGNVIWATRGRIWGFRFLLDGGFSDPLITYERAFEGLENERETFSHDAHSAAVRFSDPSGRRDAAGRVIPHEFVVSGSLADRLHSVDDGRQHIWPLVSAAYARVWDAEQPPSTQDLDFTA